jgi:WD40 repeat protein
MESVVQFRDVETMDTVAELPVSTKVISAMAFSPDGKTFLIGGADKKIRVWDLG